MITEINIDNEIDEQTTIQVSEISPEPELNAFVYDTRSGITYEDIQDYRNKSLDEVVEQSEYDDVKLA